MATTSGASCDLSGLDDLLDDLTHAIDLDQGGLGDDLVTITAEGIRGRTLDQQRTVDGDELAANQGSYGKRKRDRGVPVGVGLKESKSRMLDVAELRGDVTITATEATMAPGTSSFGSDKARWFEEGKRGKRKPGRDSLGKFTKSKGVSGEQPARPFYGVDDATEERIWDRVEKALDDRLAKL